MFQQIDPDSEYLAVNVRRLVLLRFLAVGGQIATIVVTERALGMHLPWLPLACVLGLLLGFNLLTARRLRRGGNVSIATQLWVDCIALTLVLGLTGGGTNPFAWLLLLPLVFAAMTLSRRAVWWFGGFTAACYTAVAWIHVPLPGMHSLGEPGFRLHVFGMWVGFIVCSATIAYFVTDIAQTLRRRERELAAARERELRDDHLLGVGIVAAGAAHELGTPLSTMAVLIREMSERTCLKEDPDARDDLALLRGQIDRCKRVLSVLSGAAYEEEQETGTSMALPEYLKRVVCQWKRGMPERDVLVECEIEDSEPCIPASLALTQTLANLLQNAAEASRQPIGLRAFASNGQVVLEVRDRGAGPAAIGDPHRPVRSAKGPGRGLGLYLSNALIERLGGRLEFDSAVGGGTVARITLPLRSRGAVSSHAA